MQAHTCTRAQKGTIPGPSRLLYIVIAAEGFSPGLHVAVAVESVTMWKGDKWKGGVRHVCLACADLLSSSRETTAARVAVRGEGGAGDRDVG